MRPLLAASAAILLVALAPPAAAAPHGTVVMHDGRKFEDVEYEVRGRSVRIVTQYGEVTFNLGDVAKLIPSAPEPEGGVEDLEEAEEERGIDWDTRFRLVPPDGWELVEPSGPLVRSALRHQERDAVLEVTVRPAAGSWELGDDPKGRVDRGLTDAINAELATLYERAGRGRFSLAPYQGDLVVRVDGITVTEYGAGRETRSVTEVRFQRFGFEYAVTLSQGKQAQGTLPAEAVDAALEAFSFLSPLDATAKRYSDHERGFALRSPGGDWELLERPFSEREPLALRTRDGRAEVTVEVLDGASARQAVDGRIAKRRETSRYLSALEVGAAAQDGSDVVRFGFEDFRAGGRKKLRFSGFAAAIRGRILLFTGVAPLSDEDSRKLQGEVDAILASVRLHDLDRITSTMTRQKDALGYISAGVQAMRARRYQEAVQKLDEAIARYDGYALAYYLRGQARKSMNQFDEYRADLTRAGELAPGRGYDAELVASVALEAAVEQKARNWRKAIELWVRAYRSSKEPKHLDQLCRSADGFYNDARRGADQYALVREMDKMFESVESVPKVAETLAKIYGQAANDCARSGAFSDARRILRYIRNVGRAAKSDAIEDAYDKLRDRLKQMEEKAKGR